MKEEEGREKPGGDGSWKSKMKQSNWRGIWGSSVTLQGRPRLAPRTSLDAPHRQTRGCGRPLPEDGLTLNSYGFLTQSTIVTNYICHVAIAISR